VNPVEVRVEVRPRWHFRLRGRYGRDGLTRFRGGVLHRLLHTPEGIPVQVRVAQTARDAVLFGGSASSRAAAHWGIARLRGALGVDLDLEPFHSRFRADPLIGRALRTDPALRPYARPVPFEALTWAISEQLIEYERAAAIQRHLIARLGRSCARTGLRDAPTAARLAAQAPALLASLDLAPARAVTLIRVAREVAAGRVGLYDADHERGWQRLRAIPGVGSWTIQTLASTGQGRLDQLPAGDLAYLKLVGRLLTGDPRARVGEADVERFFAPYAPWGALAGAYALRAGLRAGGGAAALPAGARLRPGGAAAAPASRALAR
jgi:3-methyladenine DNA glycosylase/8-oxoguanine DNA glycosylase